MSVIARKYGLLVIFTSLLIIISVCFSQPEITFMAPTPNNETVLVDYAYINVTLSENPDWINIEWNGTNETVYGSGLEWFINKTNLENGNYTFKIYTNNSNGDMNVSEERWVWINATRYLDVSMAFPPTGSPITVFQNATFSVNATVICRGGGCGTVNGTVRYNSTDVVDTYVNTSEGEKPFYVHESPYPSNATKDCGPMIKDQDCNLTWIINATGENNTMWLMDAVFNSTRTDVTDNDTENAELSIFACSEDFTLQWGSISFGILNPSSTQNPAPGNSGNEYNISVNQYSCNLDFYIRGTDLTNDTTDMIIGTENITWSNASNTYGTSKSITKENALISFNVSRVTNVTTWYWINVPPVFARNYSGIITITGVRNGESP